MLTANWLKLEFKARIKNESTIACQKQWMYDCILETMNQQLYIREYIKSDLMIYIWQHDFWHSLLTTNTSHRRIK